MTVATSEERYPNVIL